MIRKPKSCPRSTQTSQIVTRKPTHLHQRPSKTSRASEKQRSAAKLRKRDKEKFARVALTFFCPMKVALARLLIKACDRGGRETFYTRAAGKADAAH